MKLIFPFPIRPLDSALEQALLKEMHILSLKCVGEGSTLFRLTLNFQAKIFV